MQIISHELIYFIRSLAFGVAVGYAFFYVFLYFKPIAENIFGVKKFDTDLWWMIGVSTSVIMGIIGAFLLM
jgi:hypothetical protein